MTTPDEDESAYEDLLAEDEEPVEDDWVPVVGPDEWVERLYHEGGEWKPFHPAYICLRRLRAGFDLDSPGVYAQKSLLGQLSRIEAARWEALLKLKRLRDRWSALYDEVFKTADSECFIPCDSPSVFRIKGRTNYAKPRRLRVERSNYLEEGGLSSGLDDDFYKFEPTKHNGTEMEVIASAVEKADWEQFILPSRLARANDPIKLDLGRRWRHMEVRERGLLDRSGIMHELLKVAVQVTGIMPPGLPHLKKTVLVQINGRKYPFTITGDYVEADFDKWPCPNDPPSVVVDGPFKLDDSLIGKSPDAVRARIGEPSLTVGAVWRYPAGTVTFKQGHYGTVISVDQTPNDIPPAPARPPQPGRKRGRGAKEPTQGRKGRRSKRKSRSGGSQGVDGEVRSGRKAARSGSRKTRQAT